MLASADADADGVDFNLGALRVEPIREGLKYGGLRLRGTAALSGARIAVIVDIGFGDSVEPGLETIDYPSLLDLPTPKLRAYAPETVIAEKFQAMVALGLANSRMKDFYDIWMLSKIFRFDPDRLARAIKATFARRGTSIPIEMPDALTTVFAGDPLKQRLWTTFIADLDLAPKQLQTIADDLADFLMNVADRARHLDQEPQDKSGGASHKTEIQCDTESSKADTPVKNPPPKRPNPAP